MQVTVGKLYITQVGKQTKGGFFEPSGKYTIIKAIREPIEGYFMGIVIGYSHESKYFSSYIAIGNLVNCPMHRSSPYDEEIMGTLPKEIIKEVEVVKEVEKEVIKKVEVIREVPKEVKIDRWEDTLIDRLYNWYCEKRDRSWFVQ